VRQNSTYSSTVRVVMSHYSGVGVIKKTVARAGGCKK